MVLVWYTHKHFFLSLQSSSASSDPRLTVEEARRAGQARRQEALKRREEFVHLQQSEAK